MGAGDAIVQVGEAPERMTVAEINALLYSRDHPRDRLERALRNDALSPGWRGSFEALLLSPASAPGGGNAGLAPAAAAHPAAPGFRPLAVTAIDQESADVVSLTLQSPEAQPLPAALPGQYVLLHLHPTAGGPPLFRSYSLSGSPSTERYRISVKIEPHGVAGTYTRTSFEGNVYQADQQLELYRSARTNAEGVMREAMKGADSPELVASAIVKAATEATPRRRYTAGRQARQVSLLRRFVPESAFDKSLRKQMRLPA